MTWQRFAKDYSGHIIDIYNVSDAYVQEHGNESFKCIECGNPMLSKRGKVKEWHFAHVGGKNVVCSFESYLHRVGIIKFVEAYNALVETSKPFFLEVAKGQTCFRGECPYGRKEPCGRVDGYENIPLLPNFRHVETEIRDGDFVPDVLLMDDNGHKIYIEIVVSHFAEPRKIASGVPIVEIELKTEADLALFADGMLTQRNESVSMYNFDQFMMRVDYHCEKALQKAKNQFIDHYRQCVREGIPLKLEYSFDILCCREDCPYIEAHCCGTRDHGGYDIARFCKEVPSESSSSEFSPDFYLETKKEGEKIRFNFCYNLFTNAESFDGVRTVQFALDNEFQSQPWLSTGIWANDDDVRYFNFLSHKYKDLCGEEMKYFDLIVLGKNGETKHVGIGRIDEIHQGMSQIWDKVEDYILIPATYGQQATFYDNKYLQSLFEKSCNACLHCLDKKAGSVHMLLCQLYKRDCKNEDALTCEFFKRNLKIRKGKIFWYACSYKYRNSEHVIDAWKRYRLKRL